MMYNRLCSAMQKHRGRQRSKASDAEQMCAPQENMIIQMELRKGNASLNYHLQLHFNICTLKADLNFKIHFKPVPLWRYGWRSSRRHCDSGWTTVGDKFCISLTQTPADEHSKYWLFITVKPASGESRIYNENRINLKYIKWVLSNCETEAAEILQSQLIIILLSALCFLELRGSCTCQNTVEAKVWFGRRRPTTCK